MASGLRVGEHSLKVGLCLRISLLIKRPADDSTATVMHAGFFIGSNALYNGLRALPEERRRLIDMTRISKVNTLSGEEAEKREQRLLSHALQRTHQ